MGACNDYRAGEQDPMVWAQDKRSVNGVRG
jgi:hypothetical protein